MKKILSKLFEHNSLDYAESKQILKNIAEGKYNPSELASFLTVFLMRNITIDELSGFRDALLELCVPVDLSAFNTIDLCGTGGDGKDTFNISTLTSFVVAGAGYKVAKHGNYGVSSVCGSSNVLEYLGYKFTNNTDKLKNSLDKAGICFLHAPLFHPAMKNVAPIRRELKVKTFFNILGPLVNPSKPQNQLVGVYNLDTARKYKYLLQNTATNFTIIHSLDGYDEISLTDSFKIISNSEDTIINPEEINFDLIKPEQIAGGKTVQESAEIFVKILEGKGTKPQNDVVLANSAFAIKCINPEKTFEKCYAESQASLKNGKAIDSFKKLIENS